MLTKPSELEKSTTQFATGLWIWTGVVSLGTGITFGNVFATNSPYSDGADFSGGAFIGGLLVGAFSTIPFWVMFSLGKHILRNIVTLRSQLADQYSAPKA